MKYDIIRHIASYKLTEKNISTVDIGLCDTRLSCNAMVLSGNDAVCKKLMRSYWLVMMTKIITDHAGKTRTDNNRRFTCVPTPMEECP